MTEWLTLSLSLLRGTLEEVIQRTLAESGRLPGARGVEMDPGGEMAG